MTANDHHKDLIPRGTVILAVSLVLFALVVTSIVRIAGIPPTASPVLMRAQAGVEPVQSRSLRFIDRADGAVVIQDVAKGSIASVIQPGEKTGFIRGVMRGLARERRMHGIDDGPPFTLTLWENGQLSLTDDATGRSIEMTAFGTANRASFAALLPARKPA